MVRTKRSAVSCSRAAGLGRVPGQGDELAGGAGGGQLLGGFDTQGPYEPVGDRVERGDHRPEEAGEDVLRARDEAGDLKRLGDRPVLGYEFADHHLHGRGEQHADHDGDTGHGALGQSDRGEGSVQQFGERGFGEHADDERGDGDAELGAGELERQFLERFDDRTGPSVAFGRRLLGVGPLDRDEAELGRHEEAVGEDQQERRPKEQQGDGHDAAASICREGAAQVLQDDPSIAGGSHSSGSRGPLSHQVENQRRRRNENASANRLIKTWARTAGWKAESQP